jgi:molybdopterin-guanine dinucleotide biosynthesis protein A
MSEIAVSDITGLVLAGGKAQRMGGGDKGLIRFRGLPLIEHAITRLKPQVQTLLINANRNYSVYSAYGYPVIADDDASFAGPLAGFAAGLKVCKSPYLVTIPCDSPLFPTTLVKTLVNTLESNHAQIAYASSKDREGKIWAQPVFCLMKKELQHSLETFLASGERKIDRWFAQENACTAVFDDELAFANANTPEELADLEKNPS